MSRRVVITGVGLVGALGVGREAVWAGLCEGRSGLAKPTLFDASGFACQMAGEIRADGAAAFSARDSVPKSYRKAVKVMARDTEIAVAAACGLRIRGVAVCPMPRKSDGWPKEIRTEARENVENLAQSLHPIPVQAARRGIAPAFATGGADVCTPTVTPHGDREWIWSVSVPGLAQCHVSLGTWSLDSAYPTTHIVMDIDGRIVRRPVDATLRRCVASDAVISGDSVAITFVPHEGQWPIQQDPGAGERDG